LNDYIEMLDIVEANDLIDAIDPVQYSVRLLIPPGSALLKQRHHRAPVEMFITCLDQAGFQYHWRHPDPRMDRLHQGVTDAVEAAAQIGEDPERTFDRVRALAHRMAGREAPARKPSHGSHRRPPRMSEPWFCCAEPTKEQFIPLQRPSVPSSPPSVMPGRREP
jgi:hypothetical protein